VKGRGQVERAAPGYIMGSPYGQWVLGGVPRARGCTTRHRAAWGTGAGDASVCASLAFVELLY